MIYRLIRTPTRNFKLLQETLILKKFSTTPIFGRMVSAKWEGVVIAESDNCVVVEGNQYFPAEALKMEYFKPTDTTTVCGWKGTANYYDIHVNGKVNKGAAWYYANAKPAAENIKGKVAFWKGVEVK